MIGGRRRTAFSVLTEDAKRGINIINKREDARIEGDHQEISGLSAQTKSRLVIKA